VDGRSADYLAVEANGCACGCFSMEPCGRVLSVSPDRVLLTHSGPSLIFPPFSPSWYLSYHTPSQITLGFFLGALIAIIYALLVEVLPRRQPERFFGRTRRWLVKDVLGRWWGLRELEVGDRWDGRRDGWEMEGGRAELWRVVSKTTTGGAAPTTIRKGD
jgi:hypothetical protein